MPSRTLVVWCPDWPLVAAGLVGQPSAVLRANRVVATSPPARQAGVRLSQRRREAEAACPGLVFVADDVGRDARSFERVVSAVAAFTPQVELTRPGVCSLAARGPARYFGGEERLAAELEKAASTTARLVGGEATPSARVGIADTPFAARLAARSSAIVPPGRTREWLAPLPVGAVAQGALGELLLRIGVTTVGQFAEMDEAVVSAHFGAEGLSAHRLSCGEDWHRLELGEPPLDVQVEKELEEPLESAEAVAFVAAGLAEELAGRLSARGLACSKLLVEASTEHAEEVGRWWRAETPFTARQMVERVRWQLEGWLGLAGGGPSAGVCLIRLTAGEVAPDSGRQLGLSGERAEAGPRLARAVARVQGLLGHDSIGTALPEGGRVPAEQVRFVPWGEPRAASRSDKPWPGRVPAPSPALVYEAPEEIALLGPAGEQVGVGGRGRLSCAPAQLVLGGDRLAVTAWAGPWPLDERWWDPASHRRRARLQVLLEDGSAHLVGLEKGRWRLEASYD